MYYELTDHFQVPATPEQTWQFFSAAENLPLITPPWLNFSVTTPAPITLQNDSLIDYTIRWMNLPLRWRTRIIDWSPPHQFIDLQLKGPYTLWHHQHTFTPAPDGAGTVCRDRVLYKLPLGPLGRLFHPLTVRRQLLHIFRFRRQAISQHLGLATALQPDVQIRKL